MHRIVIAPRPDWRKTAEECGFHFADMYGAPYWDESAMFLFSLREIEDRIEDPSKELHGMCLELADRASRDERMMRLLGIPDERRDDVAASWRNRANEPSLYGRFDLAYDGSGPAKMLEYNADTPTGLYEAACFQWVWLEQCIENETLPQGADQFNSIHEALIARFGIFPRNAIFHFAGAVDNVEDVGTLQYLRDCAIQAGHLTELVGMDAIGVDAQGRFLDHREIVMNRAFKLHPWEWMLDSPYAGHVAKSGCQFVEPLWKTMLSTKGILPLLWEMFPNHPNLLPCFFADDPRAASLKEFARKPIFSREGANVTLVRGGEEVAIEGPYGDGPMVVQEAAHLFESNHGHAVIGSWIVGDEPCGMGIREDVSAVTMNMSRFVPHCIVG